MDNKKWIPCTCPKGGMYEDSNGKERVCEKCGGTEWIKLDEKENDWGEDIDFWRDDPMD